MKQLTSPEQMASLSPVARSRLTDWLKEKEYGSFQDGDFFPITQLSIGQMIEFLEDIKENYGTFHQISWQTNEELVDKLFTEIVEILEQKN